MIRVGGKGYSRFPPKALFALVLHVRFKAEMTARARGQSPVVWDCVGCDNEGGPVRLRWCLIVAYTAVIGWAGIVVGWRRLLGRCEQADAPGLTGSRSERKTASR